MTQRSNRITCPRCGANNFDTVSACWKCSTPLTGVPPMSASMSPSLPAYGQERIPSQMSPIAPAPTGDPNVATRAAIFLAVTIPFIGLPAGWLFMMVEDHNKQRVGRICVIWSLFAMAFHVVFFMMATKWFSDFAMHQILPLMKGMSGAAGGQGGGGLPSIE